MAEIREIRSGQHWLAQFDGEADIETNAGSRRSQASGEIILEFIGEHEGIRGVRLHREALVVAGVEAKLGDTGPLSIIAEEATGMAKLADEDAELALETVNRIHYPRLDEISGRATDKGDYYLPTTEPAGGRIAARLAGDREGGLTLFDVRIEIVCAAGEAGEVALVVLHLDRVRLVHIRGGDRPPDVLGGQEFGNCDTTLAVTPRQLIVAPVGFRDSAADASPSGSTAAAQLSTAASVWGKGCIQLQVKATTFIVDATLKTSSDQAAIRAAFTDPDPNAIEVYFVQNALSSTGGGNAGAIGTAACKPVIAEPNGGNPVLVAHELGHVLGLQHPGTGSNSDAGTVMAPTGSAMNPGTNLVTHFMCTNISNPVLRTLATQSCCLTHDIGNHYLRDFPVDIGTEPSDPLPAGMTRYSMSNVWNRRSDTEGIFGSAGPGHEQPIRFNADATPFTNFLFARVEQLANLKVRSATVRYYLKQPGSGGGAANLRFLGEVAVPDTLAVGVPQTIRLPWTVPAGMPGHSCVFAVVRSPSEPEGDQTGLDWASFEALGRADNDWAQRNLEIADYANSNEGDSNIESAPFLIRLPNSAEKPERLLVLVSVVGPGGIVTIEVDGTAIGQVAAGKSIEVPLKGGIAPGQNRVVIAQASIPARTTASLEVRVDPIIGERVVVGFASRFSRGPQHVAVAQTIDLFAGAADDADRLLASDASAEIRRWAFDTLKAAPSTRSELSASLGQAMPALSRFADELELVELVPDFGVRGSVRALAAALSSSTGSDEDYAHIASAARSVATRLAGFAALGLESQLADGNIP